MKRLTVCAFVLLFALPLSARDRARRVSVAPLPAGSVAAGMAPESYGRFSDLLAHVAGDEHQAGEVSAQGACDTAAATLSCGQSLNASISTSDCLTSDGYYVEFYRFDAPANQTFSVTATSTSSHIILLTIQDWNSGEILSSNFAAGSVTTSYSSAQAGPYAIGVGFVAKFATGPYTLSATCQPSGGPDCTPTATLTCGTSLLGSLSQSDCDGGGWYYDVYRVSLDQGETIDVTYNGELPGFIDISYSADAGEGVYVQGQRTLTARFTATRAGLHDILISTAPSHDGQTGGYTVTLSCPSVPPCKQRAVRK